MSSLLTHQPSIVPAQGGHALSAMQPPQSGSLTQRRTSPSQRNLPSVRNGYLWVVGGLALILVWTLTTGWVTDDTAPLAADCKELVVTRKGEMYGYEIPQQLNHTTTTFASLAF